jgi:hypothetical protein
MLIVMFFHELDSVGRDYWLDSAVSAWTDRQKMVVDHSLSYSGNTIFGRRWASDGSMKSLFKPILITILRCYGGS